MPPPNTATQNVPLVPPKLVRYIGAMPAQDVITELTYDEALDLANGKKAPAIYPKGGGEALAADTIARRYTEYDEFQTVERVEKDTITVRKGAPSMPYTFAPNPKYGDQLVCEVGWLSAFEQMMQVPTVFEWAVDLEHERDSKTVLEAVKENPKAWGEALLPVLDELGMASDAELSDFKGQIQGLSQQVSELGAAVESAKALVDQVANLEAAVAGLLPEPEVAPVDPEKPAKPEKEKNRK